VSGHGTATATSSSNSDSFKTVNVECPAGQKVLGGGGSISGGGNGVVLRNSFPNDFGNIWTVSGIETTSTTDAWSVRVRAVCANVAP
jgi:hypothetical protein